MDIVKEFEELKELIQDTYHLMDRRALDMALEKLDKIRKEVGA